VVSPVTVTGAGRDAAHAEAKKEIPATRISLRFTTAPMNQVSPACDGHLCIGFGCWKNYDASALVTGALLLEVIHNSYRDSFR
jgi:hypothetical protein